VRYRVKVSSPAFNAVYPDQNHTESNYAYYVYDGYPLVNGTYDIAKVNPMQEISISEKEQLFTMVKYMTTSVSDHVDAPMVEQQE